MTLEADGQWPVYGYNLFLKALKKKKTSLEYRLSTWGENEAHDWDECKYASWKCREESFWQWTASGSPAVRDAADPEPQTWGWCGLRRISWTEVMWWRRLVSRVLSTIQCVWFSHHSRCLQGCHMNVSWGREEEL